MNSKKIFYSLDLLKFLMCILIVEIHTYGFLYPIELYYSTKVLISQAVPVFFIISSYLFFRGYFRSISPNRSWGGERLWHFSKRLLILYLFWFVVWLPWVIKEKELLHHTIWENVGILIHDFFFSYTFHGSWFLSGLLIAVFVVWLLNIAKLKFFIIPMALFCYGLLSGWYLRDFYVFLQGLFRPELSLTFICALIWVSAGFFLALPSVENFYEQMHRKNLVLIYSFFYLFETITDFRHLGLISVPILFIIFHNWEIPKREIYKTLRNASIIIYIVHFVIIGIFKHTFSQPELLNGPLTSVS